ncbi:MAG: hypothetical protein PHF60_05760, partial [Candidatus ainarchaeum sp.]|nr:hypothetical protein [Candidatus ainarchaeum sp.]
MASVCVEPQSRIVRATHVPVLAIVKGFRGYKPEEEKGVRKAEVVEDEALKKLKAAWKACHYSCGEHGTYRMMHEAVKTLKYSAKDIENVSVALAEFQNEVRFSEKAGLFLSALVNNGEDSEFVIHTAHFARPIGYLGYQNTKNITVDGDVGEMLGDRMDGGSIFVRGNASYYVGWMMKSGIITVGGNASHAVGTGMDGGEIHLNGDYAG